MYITKREILIILIENIYNAPCLSKMTLLAQLCGNCIIAPVSQLKHRFIHIDSL